MKALSLAAALQPRPALLLTYAEQEAIDSKVRQRFMPIRESLVSTGNIKDMEGLADRLIQRQPLLKEVPRKSLLQVLLVLCSMSTGSPQSQSVAEAERILQRYPEQPESAKKKKSVSFRDGHDVQLIESDDGSDEDPEDAHKERAKVDDHKSETSVKDKEEDGEEDDDDDDDDDFEVESPDEDEVQTVLNWDQDEEDDVSFVF